MWDSIWLSGAPTGKQKKEWSDQSGGKWDTNDTLAPSTLYATLKWLSENINWPWRAKGERGSSEVTSYATMANGD